MGLIFRQLGFSETNIVTLYWLTVLQVSLDTMNAIGTVGKQWVQSMSETDTAAQGPDFHFGRGTDDSADSASLDGQTAAQD